MWAPGSARGAGVGRMPRNGSCARKRRPFFAEMGDHMGQGWAATRGKGGRRPLRQRATTRGKGGRPSFARLRTGSGPPPRIIAVRAAVPIRAAILRAAQDRLRAAPTNHCGPCRRADPGDHPSRGSGQAPGRPYGLSGANDHMRSHVRGRGGCPMRAATRLGRARGVGRTRGCGRTRSVGRTRGSGRPSFARLRTGSGPPLRVMRCGQGDLELPPVGTAGLCKLQGCGDVHASVRLVPYACHGL